MQLSNIGLDLIKKYEGFSAVLYICPAGYKTIGYGHLILPAENFTKLSKKQAEELLQKDVALKTSAISRLINVDLRQGQFDALVSFCFNLGSGALQRSSLRQKVNRHAFSEASAEFPKWVFVNGVRSPGLIRRRAEEREIFSTL